VPNQEPAGPSGDKTHPGDIEVLHARERALEEECRHIRKRLEVNHLFLDRVETTGLQQHLLVPDSPTRQVLATGFHRLVVLDAVRGLDGGGRFDLQLFLRYVHDELVKVFDLYFEDDAYHLENIAQVLKDEPRSLFCFLNLQHVPIDELRRLRGFTQGLHQALFLCCGERDPAVEERANKEVTMVGPFPALSNELSASPGTGNERACYLEIVDGQGLRRRIPLKGRHLFIGREPTCDIYLPHPNVSRRHAELQLTDQGRWLLQDLSSLNHVFVDNRPVKQTFLQFGTEVRIAEFRLALREPYPDLEDKDSDLAGVLDQEQARSWLEPLHAFLRSLLRQVEPRQVLERLAAEFARIVQPQLTAVGLAIKEKYRWEVMVSETNTVPASLIAEAARQIGAEDSDVQTWNLPGPNGDTPGAPPPLCLLFPIKGRANILGHVLVQRPRFCPLPFAMQRYLTLLTTYAGLVWENFQLAALRLAQKEMEEELREARQIQTNMFPPTFEVDERLSAFAVDRPRLQVSGNYYDLFRTGPDTVAFVVADAMGHGMPAALMMAAVRASLRMGVAYGLPWQAVFKGLDGIITQANTGRFVTGIVGQIDLHRNELQMVSAGHLPPSILIDGKALELPDHCQTRPWGINFDCPWEVGRIPLGSGDWSILCYTDGITDGIARSHRGNSLQFVADYHRQNWQYSAEDLCLGLLNEGSTYPLQDAEGGDQTVLVLRSVYGRK
jgi:hypothetical protein